jgi:heme-degrading monooxygenase HmoA
MVLEIVQVQVRPGAGPEFERAVEQAEATIFPRVKGFRELDLQPSLEVPDKFWLFIRWETLENHMVGFRGSPDYTAWRALVGPFFAEPPVMEHVEIPGA